MNTCLVMLLLCVLTTPVRARQQRELILFSGIIENVKAANDGKKYIFLSFPKGSGKEGKSIQLQENGSFSDTLLGTEGVYYLQDGNFPILLYFIPGKKYTIAYDAANFVKSEVILGGDDSMLNRYFIVKQQQKTFFDPSEDKPEEEYRQYLNNWKEKEMKRISSFAIPAAIAKKEQKAIQYEYLFNLFLFTRFSEMRNASYKPLSVTLRELNIDYANDEDYQNYGYYSSLVYEHHLKQLDSINIVALQTNPSFSLRQNRIRLLAQVGGTNTIRNSLITKVVLYDLKEVKDIELYYNDFLQLYTGDDEKIKEQALDAYLRLTKLKKGSPIPVFYNYTNYNGGQNSLNDYLGKFVFIDIWATWCGNCWGEFEHIKKMHEKYKNKNVVFLSISIDDNREEWANTIKAKQLPGIQLLASSSNDTFFNELAVYGVPRYLLIDPQGNIVDYSTPWPSESEKLEELFEASGL